MAIGCQGGRLAGIPGEDAEDVAVAVDFLREVNSGKIDALSGRTIVVGGGNVAIDVARNACRLGSEHVEMFCLESEAQMPASEEERREAVEDGAHISCGWGPKEIHLDEAGRVCGITFKRCTRVFDDEGRFAPEYDENDLRRVDADRGVMSIGQSIVWGDLLAGSKVELGRGQGALADPQTYQTAEPDIFVGGDVYTGPSFAIDAIAAGHEAAVSIHRFVQPGSTLTIGRNQRRYTALDRDDVVIESYDNASREVAHLGCRACNRRASLPSMPIAASAAACAPPSARLTPSIWTAIAPSAQRWSNTSKSSQASASMRSSAPSRLSLVASKQP